MYGHANPGDGLYGHGKHTTRRKAVMNTATQIMIDAAVGSDVLLDMTRKTLDGCDDPFDAELYRIKP